MMDAELILFAKTPLAGEVKTRLVSDLGEQGAADFAVALIGETVRCASDAWPGVVRLQAWPDTGHPCFERIERQYGIEVSLQSGDDLGRRMFNALNDAYERGAAAAIMGCDVPHCPRETFRTAHAFLTQGRAVIGPSADGGYYLLGVNPPHPDCFSRISWGGSKVFDTTLKRAAKAGIDLIVLQQLNDFDTAEDIETVRRTQPELVERLLREVEDRSADRG
jgi:rSAM/selenodomain-associated transferase 1